MRHSIGVALVVVALIPTSARAHLPSSCDIVLIEFADQMATLRDDLRVTSETAKRFGRQMHRARATVRTDAAAMQAISHHFHVQLPTFLAKMSAFIRQVAPTLEAAVLIVECARRSGP